MQRLRAPGLAVVVMLAITACTSTPRGGPVVHTLERNPALPAEDIRRFYGAGEEMTFLRIPYDGYVVLRGAIERDQTLRVRVVASYPDDRYEAAAVRLCEAVRLRPYGFGSRQQPLAQVHVIFYETFTTPRKALVYATQVKPSAAGTGTTPAGFLKISDF